MNLNVTDVEQNFMPFLIPIVLSLIIQIYLYLKVIPKFTDIGLLKELKNQKENNFGVKYVRLCLARAEEFRKGTSSSGKSTSSGKLDLNSLPLGPLGHLEFKTNDVLHRYLNNEVRKRLYSYSNFIYISDGNVFVSIISTTICL